MKYLIVYAHPNPKSFNHAELEVIEQALKEAGHETRVRDLYAQNFNPVLAAPDFEAMAKGELPSDILQEQEHIKWADALVFVHPVWWASMPAMLKGYIDRVFLKGFAYDYGENGVIPLLKGKKAYAFCTTGTPSDIYEKNGMHSSLRQVSDEGIFGFCGLEVVQHVFFGGIPGTTPEQRAAMLEEVKAAFR